MKRETWTVSYDRKNNEWVCRNSKGMYICAGFLTKKATVQTSAYRLRERHVMEGVLIELVIRGLDCRIQDRRTYGKDPRKTKG